MANVPKVFISATSRDLGSSRDILRLAANDMDWMPIEQKHFPPDYRELKDALRSKIKECDAVIALVGFLYGSEPESGMKEGQRRSYTQLEFEFAIELRKPVFVFFCETNYPFDCDVKTEDAELRRLQLEHRNRIIRSDRKRECLYSKTELSEKVRTLELFLSEAREGKKRRGCAIRVVISITACLAAWLGILIYQKGDSSGSLERIATTASTKQHGTHETGAPPARMDSMPAPTYATGYVPEDRETLMIGRTNDPGGDEPTSNNQAPTVAGVPEKPYSYLLYEVKSGDTFSGIAKKMGVSLMSLMEANKSIVPERLMAGTEILVPIKQSTATTVASPPSKEKTPKRSYPIPIGKKSTSKGRVISPYPPYPEVDLSGRESGSIIVDPVSKKVFQVP